MKLSRPSVSHYLNLTRQKSDASIGRMGRKVKDQQKDNFEIQNSCKTQRKSKYLVQHSQNGLSKFSKISFSYFFVFWPKFSFVFFRIFSYFFRKFSYFSYFRGFKDFRIFSYFFVYEKVEIPAHCYPKSW